MVRQAHYKLVRKSDMKKTAVAIFAHPDDESFGPAGTIHKLTSEYDVYIICATKGEIGQNSLKGEKPLNEIRAEELEASAKLLGVKKVFFLGFIDGTLSNAMYPDLVLKIEKILKPLKPALLLTFEPRGVSGHIDHITMSMVTSFIFEKLSFVKTLMYYCASEEAAARRKPGYFIYRPPGYKRSEIDKVVDITDVWDIKMKAMEIHKSQAADAKKILKDREGLPKEEYFLVRKR